MSEPVDEDSGSIAFRKRRLAVGAGVLVSFLVVLTCAGVIYQQLASIRDKRLNPPPGILVDVGGYRMHLYCIGQGSPAVVLDSGLGDSWLSWYKVQPQISQFTRVCSYDRAGMGWSDPSPKPRTSSVIASELHSLLQRAGISPPVVLVGHSFGGLNMRMYAGLYRSDIVGMVLVDSTPDEMNRFPIELKNSNEAFLYKENLKHETMPLGIPRLMGWCGNGPDEIRSVLRAIDCRLPPWREHLAEYHAEGESGAQVRQTGLLRSIPLIVLSHDPDDPTGNFAIAMEKAWTEAQQDLTHLSTNSSRVVVRGSGHNIQLDRPEVVTTAIRQIVDEVRRKSLAPVR
jgi:pimeloyl-ACP methyl ester carboxylesterase